MKHKEYNIAVHWYNITVALVFAVILLLVVMYLPGVREVDYSMLHTVQKWSSPYPQYIPWFLNEISRFNYAWPQVAACSVLVSHGYYLKAFLLVFMTQLAQVVSTFIKGVVCRERPCGDAYPRYSFPSTHTLVAACFFGILIYLVYRHVSGFWRYFLITFFGLIIILAGISRLWLNVHFPTDVIEGLLLGFILANLYAILDRAFS